LERTESALSSADTPTARAAPAWEYCDADLSSAATVIIPAPVARGTLTLVIYAGYLLSIVYFWLSDWALPSPRNLLSKAQRSLSWAGTCLFIQVCFKY
jgi:hypothetical protein